MQLSHTLSASSVKFDEPNLVSAAGLVPLMALARRAGLRELGDEHLSVPTDKGSNAGLKLASLVAGMAAGADSIDDMALLRPLDVGLLPAQVHLRARAPGRRDRLPIPDKAGPVGSLAGQGPGLRDGDGRPG